MPVWLDILLAILGGTGLSSLVVSTIWTRHKDKMQESKNRKEADQLERIRKIVREENKSTHDKLDAVSTQLDLNSQGTITLLRDRMKCSLNYCHQQGYKTTTDMANWMELYNSYKNLGGNHFREYVNQWKAEIESLPTQDDH